SREPEDRIGPPDGVVDERALDTDELQDGVILGKRRAEPASDPDGGADREARHHPRLDQPLEHRHANPAPSRRRATLPATHPLLWCRFVRASPGTPCPCGTCRQATAR